MSGKFYIRVLGSGVYWKGPSRGTTDDKSDAHKYTLEDLRRSHSALKRAMSDGTATTVGLIPV